MSRFAPFSLVHFDVSGPDAESLSGFYAQTFGWEVTPQGPGYALVSTPGDGPDGAIVEAEGPSLTIGIVVDDLAEAIETAVAQGGTEVMPPVDNGWVAKARIADPAGNVLTLIQA